MALLQVNFISESLMRTVTMQVILPVDKIPMPGEPKPDYRPFPTLYLLHGIFGNDTDWVSGTNIQRWAEDKNLAVVMPSGDNSFYVDHASGTDNYGCFIGEELVEVTRRMFRLSDRREDTFIGGLSMGGYGAIRNGLKYHRNFSRILAFSSALAMWEAPAQGVNENFILTSRNYWESCFGNLSKVRGSDMDPWALAQTLKDRGEDIPKFYMACGKEDTLLSVNKQFAAHLNSLDADVTFEIGEGAHEWDFWHRYIKKALDWLPLETQTFLNSGNVTKA
jgi:putative tributyrin esterase